MQWHTECVMRMMFRSWSMAVKILMRERLEARCEEWRSQTRNRPPITMTTMRKHQLVESAVPELLWSRDRAERETVGQVRLALREPSGRNYFTWLEEDSSRRDQGTGSGTKHLHDWTRRQAPGQGGVDPRPVALVRETDRTRDGAVRGMCGGRADQHGGRVSPEQDEFLETPTGDGRRCLRDSDGSKTLNTVLAVLGSSRGRTTRRNLSRTWEPGGGWPWQGVEVNDSELKYKLPRKQPMTSGQKRRWESGARHFFGNDGSAL